VEEYYEIKREAGKLERIYEEVSRDHEEVLISFNKPCLGEEEARAAASSFSRGTCRERSLGLEAEKRLESLLDARCVLLVTSCTHAMELAFLALGIGPGDEVLLPSFTFVSTANAVLSVARGQCSPTSGSRISRWTRECEAENHSATRAVVVVHYGGVSCQWTKSSRSPAE